MQLFGIKTLLIKPGDDIVSVLVESMKAGGITPQNNDIFVFADSAVASAEGRVIDLESVVPSEKAIELSKLY